MASAATVIWILYITLTSSSGQRINTSRSDSRICRDIVCTSLANLSTLTGCVVVIGNLKMTMEMTNTSDFENVSFPELREVTGFMVIYRVMGLESIGQLFPNLARIRGTQLVENYGLVVQDMPNLREIGLYSLLKIDRGGVVIWGGPHTCFVLTVDWNVLAPRSRHMVAPPARDAHCNFKCTCSGDVETNHCWNNKKCQRYLEGPEAFHCHEQCLGCRNTRAAECATCRHYTHNGSCVPQCPEHTIILPDSQYCITEEECKNIQGWVWNNTCVFDCPVDYVRNNVTETCELCLNCKKTCPSQKIRSLSHLQQAESCVFINGSLTIYIRAVPDVMGELRNYLRRIEEIDDYVVIFGSLTMTSLDFLSSLRVIKGKNLLNNTYSLAISDMANLQTLFTANVTRNLKIDNGKLKTYRNPMLCVSEIEKIKPLFPVKSNETDIPVGMNGYSGGCDEATVDLRVEVRNETSATVLFSPLADPQMEYTVLYVRLSPGTQTTVVPETCSESEWYSASASASGRAELNFLRPASTYALCIETYSFSHDPLQTHLARSDIINFTTPMVKPAPPFIVELVALSSDVAVLRWIDHKDYRPHVTRYELDVSLIEIYNKDINAGDHCNRRDNSIDLIDISRHAVVFKPPPDYDRGCESMCGVLSTHVAGAIAEDFFDVCDSLDSDCDMYEEAHLRTNSTYEKYVKTIALDINGSKNDFKVEGLAPFRDYKFRLRACVGDKCSRSTRAVVRTLKSMKADIPKVISYSADNNGRVSVKWEPPDVTNGPVLAYSIHVLPYTSNETGYTLPRAWCVLPDKFNATMTFELVENYKVRVCSKTLGSFIACSEWQRCTVPGYIDKLLFVVSGLKNSFFWAGICVAITIMIITSMLGYLWNWRPRNSDVIPLIDSTSVEMNETDPPAIMETDFQPMYSVPLRDTLLDY